ncbi:hypothetical protein TVAG_004050 [Trichomonas vaginalis G3]|uniref:Leucine Rich Repeat family protein n=1 Tax=Trichomonas vaginalis (strain ATCC PRA-98 / G3) TaxID=412133 RepID=A2E5B9_TRIV3|nr:L domain-like family [Trichomonas vaginalis G3]EAY12199.1 hypothetical protein TVAG_004050 [Trichomonas vaginalis G3]KAI5515401.1 L domain-like family [Trichomonas vaginalis G3]|eukprot:XP_001324422.1 hypothetical protein [Trichomonas vaginalis G3]
MSESKSRFTKTQLDSMINYKLFPVSNMRLRDLNDIEIPDAAISFDASNNLLTDFTGFEPKGNIRGVVFDNNPLVSFRNFPRNTNITSFSAAGSPLSMLPNFRQLAILVLGPKIEIINGIKVTPNEFSEVSAKTLATYYKGGDANKMPQQELNMYVESFTDALINGWIYAGLPRSLNQLDVDATRQQNDPLSVRVVRILTILRWKDEDIIQFIDNIFNETPAQKSKQKKSKSDFLDEQLQKQRDIIQMMKEELQSLQHEQNVKEDRKNKQSSKFSNNNPEPIDIDLTTKISKPSLDAYNAMLQEYSVALEQNAADIEVDKKTTNPEGLREAIRRHFGLPDNATDAQMISIMKEQIARRG